MAFEEKRGIVACSTEWGQWWQNIEEIYVEIDVPEGCSTKEIKCNIKTKHLYLAVKGTTLINGDLFQEIHPDDTIWTLEDKKMIRIVLVKVHSTSEHCWKSLLKNKYEADPLTFDKMEKNLTLERFQSENAGFDFSGSEVTGNYHGGGPQLP